MKRLGELIYRYPRPAILLLGIIAFLAAYPALQITTDFNLEGFYPQDDRVIEDYRFLEDEFGRDDNTILVGFEAGDIFDPQVLRDIREITVRLEEIPEVSAVNSIWNARQMTNIDDRLEFDPYLDPDRLAETGRIAESGLRQIRQNMLDDPFVTGFLINPAGTATAFTIEIDDRENNYEVRNRVIAAMNGILAPYDYDFRISGIPYFRNQYVNYLNDEIIIYIVISSLLIIFLLWLLYRSALGVLLPMLIVWTTLLMTIALMQLTGGYLEIMSSTIAPILLCVGVADAVHMISKYDDAKLQGLSKKKSILEMLMTLGSATFLTSITTAIGFATLASSSVVPMQRFGLYTALGVLIAYLITIIFLPAALRLSSRQKVFNEQGSRIYPAVGRFLEKISRINKKHHRKVIAVTGVITLVVGAGMVHLKVDGRVFDDINEDSRLIQDSRFFSEKLAPPFPMEFIFNTGEEEGVFDPGFIASLAEFEAWLADFDEVQRVTSFHTVVNQIHKVMNPGSEAEYPESASLVAQYILLLEMNESENLDRIVDFGYQTARFTVLIEDAGSYRVNQMRDAIDDYLAGHFGGQVETTITGTTILSANLTEMIVWSIAWSILLAITAIALIMAFLFRNPMLTFISMIPNLIPLVIIAGVLGWLGLDIRPSIAVIFTVALGIAVDDSIHYLARFRIEYMRSGDMEGSLRKTTVKTGRAIIITSIIIVAGFGSLLTSTFTSTVLMGLLVCITILAALMADLLLLPSLFYWIRPKLSFTKGAPPEPSQSVIESPQELESHPV